jgi:hypothetical protein
MARKPGYSVRITCFIEASPTDMDQMRLAISAIDAACEALRQDGFQMVKSETRFMLSREVGEEPVGKMVELPPAPDGSVEPGTMKFVPNTAFGETTADTMPPIPTALDRRKA